MTPAARWSRRSAATADASVDVDAAGNVFVAGTFVTSPSTVAKFSASGSRVWSAPLTVGAGDALSWPFVAADSAGAVTVAGTVSDTSTGSGDYVTIRFAPDGRELWRHRFGGLADPGQQDQVAGVAIDAAGAALVTGSSWNGYLSIGGTATDIVTLKFPSGAAPALVAPSRLEAGALSATQIGLRWQDDAGTEDGFRIERCAGTGCTAFAQVAVVGHDVTSYSTAVWHATPRTHIACGRSTPAASRHTRIRRPRRTRRR